jgi:hypothetical protein
LAAAVWLMDFLRAAATADLGPCEALRRALRSAPEKEPPEKLMLLILSGSTGLLAASTLRLPDTCARREGMAGPALGKR